MKATEILRSEHDTIKKMLAVLDAACDRIERKEPVAATDLVRITEFMSAFADHCHHAKEEDLLFDLIESLGLSEIVPLVNELSTEHTMGRALRMSVNDEIEAIIDGAAPDTTDFVEFARSYVLLLAHHICKEDLNLFPAVDRLLTAEQQRELSAKFDRVHRERFTADIHTESSQLVQELQTAYGASDRIARLCEQR
ncbi:MAG: hemerythrin domain-containing protein [candidate division Zixibacteria bacterium]|nr:hemerythrin domain-containing protein [candidate division Zixibacteria bacterium]MDH3939330.1 hemerythrin domain-containing protein [candidate division Zixibacteria bacterium]MDH4035280.1 hemerythrin domain-containing protein [candidate division Zixibacteria bacterium]